MADRDRRAERAEMLRAAGDWLRAERERRGMTTAQLAARIGVTPAQVSNYELGRSATTDETAAGIARALGLPELEVRGKLGLWVPGPDPYAGDERPVEDLIRTDPKLTAEQRRILLDLVEQFRRGQEEAM